MNLHQAFIAELTGALETLRLEPEFYYPESAPGQQEISIRHAEPLDAADRQVSYRDAWRGGAPRLRRELPAEGARGRGRLGLSPEPLAAARWAQRDRRCRARDGPL